MEYHGNPTELMLVRCRGEHSSLPLVFHCVLGLSRLIWNTCQYLAMCWLLHGSL